MIRRRLALLVTVATALGVPAVSGADPARPALPEAAFTTELPEPAPPVAQSGRAPAAAAEPTPLRELDLDRVPAGRGSTYADPCDDSGGDAFDIRRTELIVDGADAYLQLRTCDEDALADFADSRRLVWQTRWTSGGHDHTFSVEHTGGGNLALFRDGSASPVPGSDVAVYDNTPAPRVAALVARLPTTMLDLPPGCAPETSTECITLRLRSYASGGGLQDEMPDDGAARPSWPSQCDPSIDPAPSQATRAAVTTSSPAAAREVEAALRDAGYRADAHPTAPRLEVLAGATREVRDVLASWPEVTAVEPVVPRTFADVRPPAGNEQYADQWYLDRIGMEPGWERTTGSARVGIAIVDNGVATDRPDLAGRVDVGWDAVRGRSLAAGEHSDLGGHGTAVAGLAAASADDRAGMVGVDWSARVHPVRVFDHEGCFVSEAAYLQALDWLGDRAADGTVQVANFSLGGSAIPDEAEAVRRIVDNGAAVVAAMGNDGDSVGLRPSFPAALPEVIAVGATGGPDDALATYSNRGRHVDVVAPGGVVNGDRDRAVLTLADPVVHGPDEPFAPLAGTSFSSPLVSGLAGLYLAEHRGATPADVARALVTTARDLGEDGDLAGFDIGHGFGMAHAPGMLDHAPGQTLVRLEGADRYATNAATSARAFPDPDLVDVVLLATGQNYPDALAGGPLAAREHAPILLTPRDGLHPATVAELDRLSPSRVLMLGGPTAISDAVAADLQARGYAVERAAGPDRYATAATIALGTGTSSWRAWSGSDVVYVATGENFPDALPGGAAAASFDAPLLLTGRGGLPAPTREVLETLLPSRVIVLGGPTAVDDVVITQIEDATGARVDRAAGDTRYDTAIAALCPSVQLCRADTRLAVVATGEGFADALGGSAAAAALRAPLVLVPSSGDVPAVVEDAMGDLEPEQMVVLGGPIPIPDTVAGQVRQLAVR